jgi:hypothetical protein
MPDRRGASHQNGLALRKSLAFWYGDSALSFWIVAATLSWIVVSTVVLAASDPVIGLVVAFSPLVAYLLVAKSWIRVATVVVGGIFVFGSTTDVGAVKIVYAVAFLGCAAIASVRLFLNPPAWIRPFRPVFGLGLVLLVCIFLTTIANPGRDLTQVIRQGILYIMIPLAPVIGIDAGRDASSRIVMRWIGVIGCVAAAGFAADWLDRRGVSSLPFGRFVVSSLVLPALAFAVALVRATYARGRDRILWLLPIVIIPAAMLVTGTRTNLIVFLAILGVLGTTAKRRVPLGKALGLMAFGAAMVVTALPALAAVVISQPGFMEARTQALLLVLSGNGGADQSYAMRNEQYYYAAQWISESPFFGKGLGFTVPISLDTPLAIPIYVGIVGTVAIALFLLSFMVAAKRTAESHGYTFMHTAVTGIAIVVVANLPFGPVVEDRGFSFMLVLLSMGLSACVQERVDDVMDIPVEAPRNDLKSEPPAPAYSHLAKQLEQPPASR